MLDPRSDDRKDVRSLEGFREIDSHLNHTQSKLQPGGKIGRNKPCPCGSGKKYKKCCIGTTIRNKDK